MRLFQSRAGMALATLIFFAAVALAPIRMGVLTQAGGIQWGARWGMTDFYNGVYYPVQAFLSGKNPYNAEQFIAAYPVDAPYPPHAPINLLLHLPFGLLSPRSAGIAYFVFSVLLMLPLALMAFRLADIPADRYRVLLLAAAILLTRPGHWNLMLGQRGLFLTLITYMTLAYARGAPFRSGLGLAVSMIKPTWGVPLAILMLPCGFGRAVTIGVLLSAVVNIPLLAVLVAREGGVSSFAKTLLAGYRMWQALPGMGPAASYSRVDAATTVSRFLGHPLSGPGQALLTAAILLSAVVVLRFLTRRAGLGSRGLSVGIICLAMILSGYHNGYDLVLLVAPFLALVAHGLPEPASPAIRWAFVGLFVIPAINWIASESVLNAWQPSHEAWVLVTSVNGVCVAALFLGYLGLGLTYFRPSPVEATRNLLISPGR
jgi:hypothetical protein